MTLLECGMKIIADENLAYTDFFFSEFGLIHPLAGRTMTHQDVQDASALLVRSVTPVNLQLIQNTKIKYVGSATIGTDHLDILALEQQNIAWSNAAGCNAQAVSEYVITALLQLNPNLLQQEKQFTLGIIGLGNVGSRLAYMANLLGWNVIGYDPFIDIQTIQQVDLESLLKSSDAISIHVPLTQAIENKNNYPTYHLIDAQALAMMKPDTILINSARGAVIEELALVADIQVTNRKVVLDVFEHEPEISEELLNLVSIVTPHIAGYSLEGKARGTQMIYDAFCKTFNFTANKTFETQLPRCEAYFQNQTLKQVLQNNLTQIYDIARDDRNLRACVKDGMVDQQSFDQLRKNYPLRREWAAHGGPKA